MKKMLLTDLKYQVYLSKVDIHISFLCIFRETFSEIDNYKTFYIKRGTPVCYILGHKKDNNLLEKPLSKFWIDFCSDS